VVGLPALFQQRIRVIHGDEAGAQWLRDLPQMLRRLERAWHVAIGPPIGELSYNLVCFGHLATGQQIVVKASPPGIHMEREANALLHFAGKGAVNLLAYEASAAALLLELVAPGRTLELDYDFSQDEAHTRVIAAVIRKLHSISDAPVPSGFLTTAEWAEAFTRYRGQFGSGGPLEPKIVDQAEGVMRDLSASQDQAVLLHGDLHHGNVLSSNQGWKAIDPQGVIGEVAYEVGPMLHNPHSLFHVQCDLEAVLNRRVEVLAEELAVDADRIRGHGFSQAVLSVLWSIEDGEDDWQECLRVAEVFRKHLSRA
jgi:streptomycin 6-kinase